MFPTDVVGPIVLFMLMTLVGLELRLDDFRRVFRTPRAVISGTVGQWLALPLMTIVVIEVMDLTPAFGAGAILLAVSPGAGMSNIMTAFSRGNVALSVTLTAIYSMFAVVSLPLIASFGLGYFVDDMGHVDVPVLALMGQLFASLFVPIGFGMWLRSRNPERATELAPRLQRFVFLAIAVVMGIAFAISEPPEQDPLDGSLLAFVAAGLWTILAAAIGWGIATANRLPEADRVAFVIEFSARNIAVTAIVAMSGLDRIELSLFSGLYGAVGYPLVIAGVLLRRRQLARQDSA